MLADVCKPLSAVDFSDKLIISIAAGISTALLSELLPTAKSIVRVMPNTPALVGEGMAGLFADKNTPEIDRTFAEDLLSAVGKTTWVTMKLKCMQSPLHQAVARLTSSNF